MPVINYDDNADQLAQRAASMQHEDYMLKQKQYYEEYNKKVELMQAIDPEVLSKNFDGEVVNSSMSEITNNVYGWLKKNPYARPDQLQALLGKEVGRVAEWSNKVKSIKAGMDEFFKDVKDDGRDVNAWKHTALTSALYKNVNGKRVLRDETELDPSYIMKYAEDAWNNHGTAMIKTKDVEDGITKTAKDFAKIKDVFSRSEGATRTKEGFTDKEVAEYGTFLQWDKKLGAPVIKKGADGYMDDMAYNQFVGVNSATDKYIEERARQAMQSGDPRYLISNGKYKVPVDAETAKKIWLADRLEGSSGYTKQDVESQQPSKQDIRIYNTSGDKKEEQVTMFDLKSDVEENLKTLGQNKELTYYPSLTSDVLVKMANSRFADYKISASDLGIGTPKGQNYIALYLLKDKGDGKNQLKAGKVLLKIDKQSNVLANQILGIKAKTEAAGQLNNNLTGAGGL